MIKKILNNKHQNLAFSLIELSIVILIISIVAVAVLNIFGKKNAAEKEQETRAKLERIAEAIKIYYQKNGNIPCPGVASLTIDSSGFGVSNCDTDAVDNYDYLRSGDVPIVDLGLPPEYTFDSWGNKISYVMDVNYNSTGGAWGYTYSQSQIQIQDISGNSMDYRNPFRSEFNTTFRDCHGDNQPTGGVATIYPVAPMIPDCPLILLLSHGANGFGAFDINATQIDSAISLPIETKNMTITGSGLDRIFIDAPINTDTKDPARTYYFDDIMVYKSILWFKIPANTDSWAP